MNWGTKLIIGMALFMSFIVILVLKMVFSPEDGLIDKNYYEKGQTYNTEYNAKQRAVQDSVVPSILATKLGLSIVFKYPAHYKLVCKRPSDISMDQQFEGESQADSALFIPESKLEKGPWQIHLEYSSSKKIYLVVREIKMP